MATKRIIPETDTPSEVYGILIAMVVIIVLILSFLLQMGIWGIIISGILIAFSTDLYMEDDVPEFNALIITNSISGKMRVIFPGINFKLPWESAQSNGNTKSYIDLRVEFGEPCSETYASKDALMKTKYLYTIRPDISYSFDMTASKKIILFSSFENSAIKAKGQALFSMMLSDYYGKQESKNLLNKKEINFSVFGTEDRPNDEILKFERMHGVEVTVRLLDSDFDDDVQKYRDKIAGIKTLNDARNILMKDDIVDGKTIKGLDAASAERMIKLMEFDGYNEKDININVKAPDMKNLRDVSISGAGLNEASKGGKK